MMPVIFNYRIAVNRLKFVLEPCSGPSLTRFLQPEKWIESDNPEIIAMANQLTKDKVSVCDKARAIYDWIGNSIKYGGYSGADKGALYCFNTRTGDCSEFAYLMIAMCRSLEIPARFVEGYVYEPGSTKLAELKHDWLEVYLPGSGWVPVDPTWGRLKPYRDKYFAAMTPDHFVMTIGHPDTLARWQSPFHYFEYYFAWVNKESRVTYTENMQINKVK
jgi:transglutaminase-like putative cysteine protease